MQYQRKLETGLRTLRLLALSPLFVLGLAVPAMVAAQTTVPLKPFSSVELHSGGKAILRHGPTQRVTLLKGSLECTGITIADSGRLVIDNCKKECPRGYALEIEIVTPDISRISVADGGAIESRGRFPRQAEIGVTVSNGGSIDIRSLEADNVNASVNSGGRILTRPQTAMVASVIDGGNITYWGDARVKSSVQRGGVVERGTAAEADKPISESRHSLPPLSSVPAVPTIPPVRNPGKE